MDATKTSVGPGAFALSLSALHSAHRGAPEGARHTQRTVGALQPGASASAASCAGEDIRSRADRPPEFANRGGGC